jgi:hypothetical protein
MRGKVYLSISARQGTSDGKATRRRLGLNDPFIVPGAIVRHPDQPDWGLGQVQSAIGTRVTVNFEHAGKVVINAAVISLSVVDPETDMP